MLRFPNPGSTISNFVAVYAAAFKKLDGQVANLDSIVAATVEANLATSSGYMGEEAITRSTRQDRSRDPLYNQLKMYSELFKTMGWVHPTHESSLNFTFTLLGAQIVAADLDFWPLLSECVLGIAYPTHNLAVKSDADLRPFAFILRTMLESGKYISRDEMILGPLSAKSDRNPNAAKEMAKHIAFLRTSPNTVESELNKLSEKRKIQINTLKNYTRWPIAILRDSGWVESSKERFKSGESYSVFRLTAAGEEIAQHIVSCLDIRADHVDKLSAEQKLALSQTAHYRMLERSGFDIGPVKAKLLELEPTYKDALKALQMVSSDEVLFSPFQALSLADIDLVFPPKEVEKTEKTNVDVAKKDIGRNDRSHLFVKPVFVSAKDTKSQEAEKTKQQITELISKHKTPEKVGSIFSEMHAEDNQTVFYPLISYLFQILGFKSDYSRAGVNYQRWDAWVEAENSTLPVEIKSPTEERFLSTKAIRQALENKIVLLSRNELKISRDVTSLIVGFKLPNERGDMSNLIDDIYNAYKLNIGVIDFQTLATLAAKSLIEGVSVSPKQLVGLRGFLNV